MKYQNFIETKIVALTRNSTVLQKENKLYFQIKQKFTTAN